MEVVRLPLYFTSEETIFRERSEVWEKVKREKSVTIPTLCLFVCLLY